MFCFRETLKRTNVPHILLWCIKWVLRQDAGFCMDDREQLWSTTLWCEHQIKTAAILRKSCTKAERERWEIWCGFISKYWQIGWKSLKIYCRRKIVNDSRNCEATLLQSLSKNFVEFYCKILIFWKSFLDFNNVSYWWISWLSKLKTGDQLLIYFCNFFISRKMLINLNGSNKFKIFNKVAR